ncbi:tesmin/TSO1-like CXC domain, cysteine-rich domain-containing protein [Ditylenchus destructor]|uniref:Tesmin/TSO1-like CXC domain, cysteine-rich domain-containing protein n=1 Tax=Ditylenchus destructor TaxID=166010 RepID=A0AAD4MS44_9BILA|nr:tesmin/TSO1-like CXC domain, cysteine-rich domain-containing protein [Ditylenchus destructor]
MEQHQQQPEGGEMIAHEGEILMEAQMGEPGAEYYEEEYIEVDEGHADHGGQIVDAKGNVYAVQSGQEDEEIVGEYVDPDSYVSVDGGTITLQEGDEYVEESGQVVRVVHSTGGRQQYQPVHYVQQPTGPAYGARRPVRPAYVSQTRIGQPIGGGYQQTGYSSKRPMGQPYYNQYGDVRGDYATSVDIKPKNYYEPEEMKHSQVLRPMNIANAASGSPVISNLPFQRAGQPGGVRDPITGSILTSFMGGSAQKAKPRKSSSKKKPCNCTKSMCLKLYCDCFANGEFCLDCNCKDCHNNLDHEAERSRAIKSSLERNPTAFKPKIGVAAKIGRNTDMERLHQKGCHCKKSNCLKNYCECYEAKVPCTERCKCLSCKNTEADRHKFKDKFNAGGVGGLAQLAAVAAADARSGTPFSDDEGEYGMGQTEVVNPKSQPWFYMTEDVIEATTMCLVAQAQEMEEKGFTEEELEQSVLQEFGRCLEQIIENANSCTQQTVTVATGGSR